MWQRGLGLGLCTPRCVNWVAVASPGPPPAFVVRLPPAGAKGIVCPEEEKELRARDPPSTPRRKYEWVGRPKVWVSLGLAPFCDNHVEKVKSDPTTVCVRVTGRMFPCPNSRVCEFPFASPSLESSRWSTKCPTKPRSR